MASIRKHPRSPFWFACFTLPDGRRTQRSTRQTDRRKAQQTADAFEQAARKKLSEAQARRVVSDIYEIINGEALPSKTAREFLSTWAAARQYDTAERTAEAYGQVTRDFLESLGERANRDLTQITRADVTAYRDMVLRRTSAPTANKALKYLRVALGAACKDGLMERNPAKQVDVLKLRAADRNERRPFTMPELRAVLQHASEEWQGMILFGFYTGQRLGDIAQLTWHAVDMENAELRFTADKTGRRSRLPLAKPLRTYLESLTAGDDPQAPLFPQSYSIASRLKDRSRLSQQFHEILVAAGLAKPRQRKRSAKDEKGKGRKRTRTLNAITFHSLRHTATSLLKVAGVSEAVAMSIIGHDSKAVSQNYTHVDADAERAAVNKLPDIISRI